MPWAKPILIFVELLLGLTQSEDAALKHGATFKPFAVKP
jgi:hypothetical protein